MNTMLENKEGPFNNLEIKRLNEAVWAVNVEHLMPADWKEQINEVVANCSRSVTLVGGEVETSLEDPDFTTFYRVVKGDEEDIENRLPWLWILYQGTFRELVSHVAGHEVIVDPEKEFSVNINQLDRDDQIDGYELHTDTNPWTAMLAVTTMHEGDGGELIHKLPDGTIRETRIKAGYLYLFDGRNYPHKVYLLNPEGNAKTRTTVPMDYVFPGWNQKRPPKMKKIFGIRNGNGNGK